MFPLTEDLSQAPRTWRTAMHRAAGLVVAFATLDSYTLPGARHGSGEPAAAVAHPHHRQALRVTPRRRGHGTPPRTHAVCVGMRPQRRDVVPATRQASPIS
jgi:hypothetical protein